MERKKRTVISIPEVQPELDFAEAELSPPFTFPEYQRDIIGPRFQAGLMDFSIVGLIYVVFVIITFLQMAPDSTIMDKRVIGVYGLAYFLLVAIYYFLFMLSAGQTPGMKMRQLTVVTRDDVALDPRGSCLRGF